MKLCNSLFGDWTHKNFEAIIIGRLASVVPLNHETLFL